MNHLRLISLALVFASFGCAGYADQTARMRGELRAGNPEGALSSINEELGIENLGDAPDHKRKNTPLLMLERATILQALGRHKDAAKSFQFADERLEVQDLTGDKLGKISKYLFSDDATIYKAPPFEKLMLNGLNMLNYLVLGKISGAKVEARRFEANRSYLKNQQQNDQAISSFCSYLAGVAFESAGEPRKAMRFYADAFEAGGIPQLDAVIARLHKETGASDPRVRELFEKVELGPTEGGQLVVIVQEGLVPKKIAKRLPIGLAITRVAADPAYQALLTPKQRHQANRVAAKGLVTWINYPSMKVRRDKPRQVNVQINREILSPGLALNVKASAVQHFKRQEGLFILASLTRAVSRAVAGSVAEGLTRRAKGGGALGLLVGLAVQGTMVAADTPDTRAWASLPARIHHVRRHLPEGKHTIQLRIGNRNFTKQVIIKPNGITVINFSRLRAG